MPPTLHRWGSRLGILLVVLLLSSCADSSSAPAGVPDRDEIDLASTMDIVDANHGDDLSVKNDHFFWLSPIVGDPQYAGVMLNDLNPVVTICLLDLDGTGAPAEPGDACADGETPLATYERSDGGPQKEVVHLTEDEKYHVIWRTRDYEPTAGLAYRISVRIAANLILGIADVQIAESGNRGEAKKGVTNATNGEFVPFSDQGSLNISFRIEEGALEQAVANAVPGTCDPDDPGVVDCDVEPGSADGGTTDQGIVVTVTDEGDTNDNSEEETTSVVVIPAGTSIEDENGDPYDGDFVVILEHVASVDQDDDIPANSQVPFYAHITTDPAGLAIGGSTDPKVVICQDVDALGGYDHAYPGGVNLGDLFIFRIPAGQDGVETGDPELIPTNIEPFECDPVSGTPGAMAPSLMDRILGGFGQVAQAILPQPLFARRFTHGGLNTVMTQPRIFSNWGATLRFDAGQSLLTVSALSPAIVSDPISILIESNTLAGDPYTFDVVGFSDDGDGVWEYGDEDTPIALDLLVTVTFDDGVNPPTTEVLFDAGDGDVLTRTGIESVTHTPTAVGTYTYEASVDSDGNPATPRLPYGGSPEVVTVIALGSFTFAPPGGTTVTTTGGGSPDIITDFAADAVGSESFAGGTMSSVGYSETQISPAGGGSVTFSDLLPGEYTVTLSNDDWIFTPSFFTVLIDGSGDDLTLSLAELGIDVQPATPATTVWPVNGHEYQLVQNGSQLDWDEARAAAEALGGHLATLTSPEETAFAAGLLTARAWVGLDDTTRDGITRTWEWVTGEPFAYANWDPDGAEGGEPNNYQGNGEWFVEMFQNGRWNDNSDGDPNRPTAYLVEYEPTTLPAYGSNVTWMLPSGLTGVGDTPFLTTPLSSQGCSVITSLGPEDGTRDVWPLGGGSGSMITLVSTFRSPTPGFLGVEMAIDNDVQVILNGLDITPFGRILSGGFTDGDGDGFADTNGGFVTHEGCATNGSIRFEMPFPVGLNDVNALEIRARDRGAVGFVNFSVVKVEDAGGFPPG